MQRVTRILRSRASVLAIGLAAILLIGLADRAINDQIPLVLLYIVPVAAISTVLERWQIPLLGIVATAAAELCDDFPFTLANGIPRDALYLFAYTGTGLYVHELLRRRHLEQEHVRALELEIEARQNVEEQLRLVVSNSSIAILTADASGVILETNEAAEALFRGELPAPGTSLRTHSLKSFLPSLSHVQSGREGFQQLRTMMQCQGFRQNGEPFLADVWFSTYMTASGGRLTAMFTDSSLELRDREEANLEQVLTGSRLAVGALSHEIRNICAAITIVHQSLSTNATPQDAEALSQLVTALERIASHELSLAKRQSTRLPLDQFLSDLYIIISPSLREAGIALEWSIEPCLPAVRADAQSLLQVFLNLVRNAESALRNTAAPRLCIHAARRPDSPRSVVITVADNGPGVRLPEHLFRPFNANGQSPSGFGLYLSRAMMLSFQGDLRYQAAPAGLSGATFALELVAAGPELST